MNSEVMQAEDVEIEVAELELISGSEALGAVERASIDMQVATAKQFPRSVTSALREALELATLDEQTAESMFYVLPRGGKRIEGPSARLAEIMVYAWGNLRAETDVEAIDRTHVTAVATCFDAEKNIAIRVRVKRRITNSRGQRYNEDMIVVTCNAAMSIALRNAVFKAVPAALVNRIYLAARKASIGEAGTMTQKRQNAMDWFAKAGVTEDQVFAVLEVKGLDDIGEDELITLRGLKTAIKDGETSVEQVFRRHDVSDGADELNDALGDQPKGPDATPVSLGELEELAGIKAEDREAICANLGFKIPAHDEAAYVAELQKIIAEQSEKEA